jgi:hypothetical protein
MLKMTYTAQLASLLLVAGWFALSGTTAEAAPDTAPGQQALLEGSNAQDASAAGQEMERKTEAELSSPAVPGLSPGVNAQPSFKGAGGGIKCVRQMPRYRPAPDFVFKC